MSKRLYRLLIAAAGSVAALKIPLLLKSLIDISVERSPYFFEMHLIFTQNAKHFFKLTDVPKEVMIYDDDLEWSSWRQKGDVVWHVELAKMTDMLVIAPLNANTMSKIANGMCDNFVTSTIRTWDFKKPVIFCPAMNVKMWEQPITKKHVNTLKSWGFIEVPPISKRQACNSVGVGAMADIKTIIGVITKVVDTKLKHRSCKK